MHTTVVPTAHDFTIVCHDSAWLSPRARLEWRDVSRGEEAELLGGSVKLRVVTDVLVRNRHVGIFGYITHHGRQVRTLSWSVEPRPLAMRCARARLEQLARSYIASLGRVG